MFLKIPFKKKTKQTINILLRVAEGPERKDKENKTLRKKTRVTEGPGCFVFKKFSKKVAFKFFCWVKLQNYTPGYAKVPGSINIL